MAERASSRSSGAVTDPTKIDLTFAYRDADGHVREFLASDH